MKSEGKLFLLDANALLHRAWHALPPLTSPDGQVVNAVYGTMMVVMKLLQEASPDAFAACWDTKAPTFRHEAYASYKAHREEQPDELYAQIPLIKEGLELLGIPSLEKDGFEADDLLGTLAVQSAEAGWEVVIVTGDRDALQLIRPGIRVMSFKKGVSETIMFDEKELLEQYGLNPRQFLEYKAMRGDPSDNIPGIKGIGEKGATKLLQDFGSLRTIFQAAHDEKSDIPKSQREKLLQAESEMPAIIKLVEIDTHVPIKFVPKRGSARIQNQEAFIAYLRRLGFKALIARTQKNIPQEQQEPEEKGTAKPAKKRSKRETIQEVLIETEKDFEHAVASLRKAAEIVVCTEVDTVASLFAGSIHGLVLANEEKAYVFPRKTISLKARLSALQELLDQSQIGFAAHDVKSEMRHLAGIGLVKKTWFFDTMLAAYLLAAGERNHDLSSIAERFGGVPIQPDSGAVERARAIVAAIPPLRTALKEEALEDVLKRFELPLAPILFEMEAHGIKIDSIYLQGLSKEFSIERKRLEKRMYKMAGREFNPASPQQLAEILFNVLELPTKGIKRGKTGYSTAAPELEKLRGTHPIIEHIEDFREYSKLLSTYVDVLPKLADEDGRIHTTYNQAVTSTGRLSSTEPNLQNIPIRTEAGRRIRKAFIAEDGFQLLSCDYSQIELRIAAALAKDERMLDAFARGDDVHTATAAAIWHIGTDEVTKEQRRIAKAINFGLIFGQGPQGLAQTADISYADAKKFIAAYFEAHKGIKRYMDETKLLARKLGYVETFFGRRRYIPEIHSSLHQLRAQAERMAINMPVQGTDADIMKLAMIKLHEELPSVSQKTRMLLQVHDELVFEVPDRELSKVASFAKETMEQIEKIGVPIVVETKAGRNWEDMKRLS